MNTKPQLLASAGTLDQIGQCIANFYGGEHKELFARAGGESWSVLGRNGAIPGVRVVLLRGRYRFEAAQ